MDCRNFRKKHLAFVDDTLSGYETSEMRYHLVRCPECARHDSRVRRALLVARNLPQIDVSETFSQRLAQRIERERYLPRDASFPRGPGLVTFSAIAASLIGIGVLTVSVFSGEESGRRRDELMAVRVVTPSSADSAAATAFVASMSTGMPVWQALWLAEQAPAHFIAIEAHSVAVDATQQ